MKYSAQQRAPLINSTFVVVKNTGFTLVELLIAVSIIAILTGVMVPGFSRYIDNQNTRQAQEQVKSDLRTVQNKALTGVMSSAAGVNFWGIRFTNGQNTYNYFYSENTDSCLDSDPDVVVTQTSDKLNGEVVVRNAGTECVFFSLDNGDTVFLNDGSEVTCVEANDNSCTIALGTSTATSCEGIKVNQVGLVKKVGNVTCQ